MEPGKVCRPVVADPHYLDEEQDPDQHSSEMLDPDLHPSATLDPDPY
jgi:hypothetical protein